MAPLGYMTPVGYWLIASQMGAGGLTEITGITAHGGNPPIVLHNGRRYVGNRTEINLPMAGGAGAAVQAAVFAAVGLAAISASVGVLMVMKAKRNRMGNGR